MGRGTLAGREFSDTGRLEANLSVFPAWVDSGADGKNGGFAGREGGVGNREDQAIPRVGRGGGHRPIEELLGEIRAKALMRDGESLFYEIDVESTLAIEKLREQMRKGGIRW